MIGKSYPGITQLFVAEAQPPHLAAIAPGHYFADAYRDVAFPGGILNYAFASLWSFIAQPAPGYQAQPQRHLRPATRPAPSNLDKHARNVPNQPVRAGAGAPLRRPADPERAARSRTSTRSRSRSTPRWRGRTSSSPRARRTRSSSSRSSASTYRAVLSNGDHGMYRRGPQLAELDRFFEAHVERPRRPARRHGREALPDRSRRSPCSGSRAATQPRWKTHARGLGSLRPSRGDCSSARGAALSSDSADRPRGRTRTRTRAAGSQGIGNPAYAAVPHDRRLPVGRLARPRARPSRTPRPPLADDVTMLGSASADLWITATAPNVDLQVTLTEIRPDGQEVFVQQGWLRTEAARARRATLDRAAAGADPPRRGRAGRCPTRSLPMARVEIFPFGHVVREGSQLRVVGRGADRPPAAVGLRARPDAGSGDGLARRTTPVEPRASGRRQDEAPRRRP